jgi:glycosyltransferase involved in cell wall biosynthesis
MQANSGPLVSVIVTTRNSARTLETCLLSIRAQTYLPIELIVVDNHSGDVTRPIAGRYADQVITMGPERSVQRNTGASVASGAYFLFIDADMVLDPDVVRDGVSLLKAGEMPAAIIPEQSVGVGFWTHCRTLERSCYAGDDHIEAARLYRRDVFADAGGFDPDITGAEDWDLSRRVARGVSLPRTSALIRHDEGRTLVRLVYAKRRYYAPGYLRFLRKHGRDVAAQGNPIIRAAYLRNWRMLARHPVLTAGMVTLKCVELVAVVDVAARDRLGVRAHNHQIDLYGQP